MSLIKYIAIAALLLFALVLALIGILSVTHDTPVRNVIAEGDKDGPPSIADSLFSRSIELYTGTHIDPGNKVQILLNGDGTYPQLWKDLASAQRTITVQMYYSQPGAVADTMAKYLIEKARQKVRVLLLLDAFGSQPLKREWLQRVKASGVEVVWLRPLRWYSLQKAAQRSHVRVVVVDGRIGYTGGFGLADYWLGDGHHEDQWRETNVRFEGPTVAALQATFAAGWAEATGELLTGDMFFPKSSFAEVGNVKAGLMHSVPSMGSTPAERFLALTIAGARKSIYISNSYFVPGENFMQLLLAAQRRGVDVRVITVSKKTDVKTTWYAGRTYYEKLLEGGVKIYEYEPTMMHAKSMVVDGTWSYVGSMNFDNRSLSFNDESLLVALDPAVGAQMNSIFTDDIKSSQEVKLDEFRKRPLSNKILEWCAQKLRRVL
ncbi:MAG TPA: phospholipase D-like domain-containing protein [Gemmatimonadaceae bacterium]|jgi:cardiolipin synthase|nr:phospholipase D-like domain-containing protein [Gemmatimonadaceae bacterium]